MEHKFLECKEFGRLTSKGLFYRKNYLLIQDTSDKRLDYLMLVWSSFFLFLY